MSDSLCHRCITSMIHAIGAIEKEQYARCLGRDWKNMYLNVHALFVENNWINWKNCL